MNHIQKVKAKYSHLTKEERNRNPDYLSELFRITYNEALDMIEFDKKEANEETKEEKEVKRQARKERHEKELTTKEIEENHLLEIEQEIINNFTGKEFKNKDIFTSLAFKYESEKREKERRLTIRQLPSRLNKLIKKGFLSSKGTPKTYFIKEKE